MLAGPAAVGLLALAGSWSAQYLTDGFVPDMFVSRFPDGPSLAGSLIYAGFWIGLAEGYQFLEWDEQGQNTRASTERLRAKWREEKRLQRHQARSVRDGLRDGVRGSVRDRDREPLSLGSTPNPDSATESAAVSVADRRFPPDVSALCSEHKRDRDTCPWCNPKVDR